MPLSKDLEKLLSKKYSPSIKIEDKFRGKDITFTTNELGDPILLFIGVRKEDGTIKGERYSRRLIKNEEGKIIKSHWDKKG